MRFSESEYRNQKEMMKKVRTFAEQQNNFFNETGEYPPEAITFEMLGHSVLYPFADETQRFDFSDEEAFEYYGTANMDYFIREVLKRINEE